MSISCVGCNPATYSAPPKSAPAPAPSAPPNQSGTPKRSSSRHGPRGEYLGLRHKKSQAQSLLGLASGFSLRFRVLHQDASAMVRC